MKTKLLVLLTLGLVTVLSACETPQDTTPTGTPENPSPTTPPEAQPTPSPTS